MKKILIGSNNPGKVADYKKLLSEFKLEIVTPKDLDIEAPDEPAESYEENAIHKAKYYFEKSGIPSLVDDAGFEVDALNGEPGVKSRRWLGRESTDEELIQEIMNRMKGVPPEERKCRLSVVVALSTPFGIITSDAHIAGVVAENPTSKRIKGYPFRSVMVLPGYDKFYCDLTNEEKNILNHRKAALEKIKDMLLEISKE